jgi:isopropanol dehydrogenase (NADP+)
MLAGLADWRHPRPQRGEGKFHQSKSPYFSDDPANGGWFSELVKRIIEGVAQEDS